MQPIRRILVAVKDPAARALPAVNKAAQIAKGLKAQLTLFHDIATPLYAEALQGREVDLRSWQREVQTARREQLEKLAARVRKHGIDVDVAADWDFPPYEAIIRKAQRISADLLVVENHHGTGRHPARWLLAYTDWELLRLCPIPVLLVKNRRLYHRPRVLAAASIPRTPCQASESRPADPARGRAAGARAARRAARTARGPAIHASGSSHARRAAGGHRRGARRNPAVARDQLAKAVDGFDVKRSHCHLVRAAPNDVIPRTAKTRTLFHRRDGCRVRARG
jgi:universal stress protein E